MKTITLSKCDTRGLTGAKFAMIHNDVVWAVGRTEASCRRDFKRGCRVAGVKADFGEVYAIAKVLP